MWIQGDADFTIRMRDLYPTESTAWELDGANPKRGGIVSRTCAGYSQYKRLAKEIAVRYCGWIPENPWVRARVEGEDWVIEVGNLEEVI